ncbi:hypothetical protein C2W62_31975 [Candidatus Entotheonella serta]|nr:hypothetical protein C2W62_31975 [Candidatus Entotheonella serta]
MLAEAHQQLSERLNQSEQLIDEQRRLQHARFPQLRLPKAAGVQWEMAQVALACYCPMTCGEDDLLPSYLVFADFLLFCELVKLSIGRAVQQPDELDKSEEALHAQLINSMPC